MKSMAQLVRNNINADLASAHISQAYASSYIGVTDRTWRRKKNDPDLFTAGELKRLSRLVSEKTINMIIGKE